MSAGGWFLLHRAVWDSPDFKPEPFSEREAFIWSVSQAAFEPHLQWFNGVRLQVQRGQFATSTRKLAKAFKWSEKRVRSFIGRMETGGNWTHQSPQEAPHHATLITVCNYERFQSPLKLADAPTDAPNGTPRTHRGRTEDAQQKEGINKGNEGERSKGAPALPYADAVAIWTELAEANGWSPVHPTLPLNDKRRKMLGETLKAHGLDGWRAGLERAASSEMLCGPDPPGWFNFTFAINPNNFVKISEGNYDRSFTSHSGKQQRSAWGSINAQLGGSAGAHQHAQPSRLLLESDQRALEG